MLEKFPVTSKSGKEYLAEIKDVSTELFGKRIKVTIFTKGMKKQLWMERECFYEVFCDYHDITLSLNYVNAVKKTVEDYEHWAKKKEESIALHKDAKSRNEKQFEEWNGKC